MEYCDNWCTFILSTQNSTYNQPTWVGGGRGPLGDKVTAPRSFKLNKCWNRTFIAFICEAIKNEYQTNYTTTFIYCAADPLLQVCASYCSY